MYFSKDKKIIRLIEDLLSKAIGFGVSNEAKLVVEEYIEYNEFGLAFDHIIYELNENSINISEEFYIEAKNIADLMSIDEREYRPRLENLVT